MPSESTDTTIDDHRFALRAELARGDEVDVSYAIDLAPTSVFVATDWSAEPGEAFRLRLSFPRLLAPLDVEATVVECCEADGPGMQAGLRLRFAADARLTALLARAGEHRVAPRACRILLVEDNQFICDVFDFGMRAFFEARGFYTVDHAETVDQAWELLDHNRYDIAIIDYYLPPDTGATLIARIRANPQLADLPIVAVSIGGRPARDASLATGADLFLDKPLVFRDLFTTLRLLTTADLPPADPKKTILVFDDSVMVLELTRAALESAGFSVACAGDLATFEHHRGALDPDLILVDVQMPEAFGDDIVLALREGHGVRIPILLVSSLEDAELATRAKRSRAAGYIQKRAGIPALIRRCKDLLEAGA